MILRTSNPARTAGSRRGAILIVVLAMLAIFAVVAITFVMYSGAEADGARIYKQGQTVGDTGTPNPNEVVNAFLNAVIFDAGDTSATDLLNNLRGHSLSRTMYGWQGTIGNNTVPFNGVGTFHNTAVPGGVTDRAYLVNHTVVNGQVYDPEYNNPRNSAQLGTIPAGIAGNVYIPKNAPYTYVDANNMALAAISPQTGEVVVPSYFRSWQFGGTLDPNNPNWTNSQGRYLIMRPRPQDNIYNGTSEFPYVPQNVDGTYTGDVANLPGGYNFTSPNYNARNDSIWIDIGLPPRLWNGKWVKPLVAALIIDKDGCVNLSAHGNLLNGGNHSSFAGYGPWEVNPNYVLNNPGESNTLVSTRQGGAARSNGNATARAYAYAGTPSNSPYTFANYAGINWNAGGGTSIQMPGSGPQIYMTVPNYTGYSVNTPPGTTGHPALYNPAEWQQTGGPRTFASSDLRFLNTRFAAELDYYKQTDLAKLASPPNTSLIGTSNSRTDVAHSNRLSVTTFGATLDVPGFMPFGGTAPTLQYSNRLPANGGGASGYAMGTASALSLGPVNLNRPLADYRNDLTNPLSNGNIGNAAQAKTDRQLLARDIFARLCQATGAVSNGSVTIDTTSPSNPNQTGNVKINEPFGSPKYDALRYLAQLSANIVDYIDNDDISTTFVWNPSTAGSPSTVLNDPANFAAAQLSNRVVFGMEKPRLVINEVYSEIANDPTEITDPAKSTNPVNPASVRFWIEFLNPANGAGTGAIGDGSVQVVNFGASINSYRVQIARDGAQAATDLSAKTNVVGKLSFDPEIEYYFGRRDKLAPPSISPNGGIYNPNGDPTKGCALYGPYMDPPGTGTGVSPGPQPFEFNPQNPNPGPLGAPWTNMVVATDPDPALTVKQNALTYYAGTLTAPKAPPMRANLDDSTYKRHVALLQRLVNPYQAYDPVMNPYITVDYMAEIPSFDSVNRAATEGTKPKTDEFVPMASRFAKGKVQPYAGFSAPATMYNMDGTVNAATYPTSFVLAQQGTDRAAEPLNTFGRHNGKNAAGPGNNITPSAGGETLLTPFEWVVHFDRPLANQLELLHVAAVPSHNLTQMYVSAPTGTLRKDMALAPWLGSDTGGTLPGYTAPTTNNDLYRAFDLLRVKPFGFGVPMGSKVHGKINVNTVQDYRVLQGLFDPTLNPNISSQMPGTSWNTWFSGWMNSRTPMTANNKTLPTGAQITVPVPGPTTDDIPGSGTDRPFKPFGVGEYTTGTIAASGIDSTILRFNGGSTPVLWNTTLAPPNDHLYNKAEAARKILNNTTTVSNSYVAFFTVSYFEVRTDASGNPVYQTEAAGYNRAILGKEAFKEVPGDIRQKFFTVIDRNNLTINAAMNGPGPRPAFSTLESVTNPSTITVAAGTDPATGLPALLSDGFGVPLKNGTILLIGDGVEQEVVSVQSASAPSAGVSTVTLSGAMAYPHPLGSSVSNVTTNPTIGGVPRLGNPGPQSVDVFNPNDPVVQAGVIRDFGQVK